MAKLRRVDIPDLKEFNEGVYVRWNEEEYPTERRGYRYKIILTAGNMKWNVCAVKDEWDAICTANGVEKFARSLLKALNRKDIKVRAYCNEVEDPIKPKPNKLNTFTELSKSVEFDVKLTEWDLLLKEASLADLTLKSYIGTTIESLLDGKSLLDNGLIFNQRSKIGHNLAGVKRLKDFFNKHNRIQITVSQLVLLRDEWLGEGSVQDALDTIYDALKSGEFTKYGKYKMIRLKTEPTTRRTSYKLKPIGSSFPTPKEITSEKYNGVDTTIDTDMESEEDDE